MTKSNSFVDLANVRVAFDRKTNSVVLTSTDERLDSNLLVTVKQDSPAAILLKELLARESVNVAPKRRSSDFDGVDSIIEAMPQQYLVVGSLATNRFAFGEKLAQEAIRRHIPTLILSPSITDNASDLLKRVEEFRYAISKGDHPRAVFVMHYEPYNKWGKNARGDMHYSSMNQEQRDEEESRLKTRIELSNVINSIMVRKNVISLGISAGIREAVNQRVISFIPVDDVSLRVTADNLRVGYKRLQSVVDTLEVNNYMMYADGDIQVGTV